MRYYQKTIDVPTMRGTSLAEAVGITSHAIALLLMEGGCTYKESCIYNKEQLKEIAATIVGINQGSISWIPADEFGDDVRDNDLVRFEVHAYNDEGNQDNYYMVTISANHDDRRIKVLMQAKCYIPTDTGTKWTFPMVAEIELARCDVSFLVQTNDVQLDDEDDDDWSM